MHIVPALVCLYQTIRFVSLSRMEDVFFDNVKDNRFVLLLLFPRHIRCDERRSLCDCTSTITTSWIERKVMVSLQKALTARWRRPRRMSCSVLCSRLRRRTTSATRDRTPVGSHSSFFGGGLSNRMRVSRGGNKRRRINLPEGCCRQRGSHQEITSDTLTKESPHALCLLATFGQV